MLSLSRDVTLGEGLPKSWATRQNLNQLEPFKLETAGEETKPALAIKPTHNSQADSNSIIDFPWLDFQGHYFESSTSLSFFGPCDFKDDHTEQFWKNFGHLETLNGHEQEVGRILVFFESSLSRYLYYVVTRENQNEKTTFANF